MSTNADFDRVASSWLAAGPTELNDRVLDAALDEVHMTRQRRRWSAPWRFTYMPMISRTTVSAAVLLIAVAGVGGAVYLNSNPANSGSKPTPTPVATPVQTAPPTTTPSATPLSAAATFPGNEGLLEAGTYRAGAPFRVPNLTFTVPAGWSHSSGTSRVVTLVIESPTEPGSNAAFVNFSVPEAIYADPCKTGTAVMVPALSLTAEYFVASLSKLPKFTVGPITDVLVDGIPGKELDLTAPDTGCTSPSGLIQVWSNGAGGGATLPGLRQHVIAVDVEGTRLVIEVLYADRSTTFQDDIDAIISSIRFE